MSIFDRFLFLNKTDYQRGSRPKRRRLHRESPDEDPPEEPQVSNQSPQVSDQEPQVSNQRPQVSDQEPQVSNQSPQDSTESEIAEKLDESTDSNKLIIVESPKKTLTLSGIRKISSKNLKIRKNSKLDWQESQWMCMDKKCLKNIRRNDKVIQHIEIQRHQLHTYVKILCECEMLHFVVESDWIKIKDFTTEIQQEFAEYDCPDDQCNCHYNVQKFFFR